MVLCKIDAEKGPGPELAKTHQVKGYPTFVLVNTQGESLDRWAGYSKASLIETLGGAVADPTTIEQKKARFAARPSPRDAALLARVHDSMGEYREAVDHYRRAQALGKGTASDYSSEILEATYGGYARGNLFTLEELQTAAGAVLALAAASPQALFDAAHFMESAAHRENDMSLARPYLAAAITRTEGTTDESVIRARRGILPSYALHVQGDMEKAVAYKRESMPEGWTEDAGRLNEFAWWCFENQVGLREAKPLAEKAVALAEPGKEKAQILDTLAEICNGLKDCRQAVDLTRQAIAEDPSDPYFKQQLEKFESILAAQG